MDDEQIKQVNSFIDNLESEHKDIRNKLSDTNQAMISNGFFASTQDSNLIVFQLELDNIMEKIEHLLRGDVLEVQGENLVFTKPQNNNLIVLNDYGVQLIMNVISFYLNRNTILSNYEEDRIYEILCDLGEELADLIFCNYEIMGMDNESKKSRYPMLVLNILHTIESSYNRSLDGGERESLRSARIVTQNEPLSRQGSFPQLNQDRKKFSLFNPKTW